MKYKLEILDLDLDNPNLDGIASNCGFEFTENPQDFISEQHGYSIYYEPRQIILFICLSEGYRDFNQFSGTISKSGHPINLDSRSNKEIVQSLFDNPPAEEWCDGVESYALFERDNLTFEFSWLVESDPPALISLIIEMKMNPGNGAGKRGQCGMALN